MFFLLYGHEICDISNFIAFSNNQDLQIWVGFIENTKYLVFLFSSLLENLFTSVLLSN